MYFNAKKRQLCDAKNASVLLAYAKPASNRLYYIETYALG